MCRIIEPAISMIDRGRSRAAGAPSTRSRRAGLADQHRNQLDRGVEVADQQQILEQADHRLHQLAPAIVVLLDPQQIEDQREVERAQRGGRDRAEPRADALRRIVADLFDFDRLRARARQLACRSRRRRNGSSEYDVSSFSRDVVPDRLEAFGAAERRRRDVVARERQQPLLLIRFAHQRLERLRQAIGRRAL